jgi:hypothetical protein
MIYLACGKPPTGLGHFRPLQGEIKQRQVDPKLMASYYVYVQIILPVVFT